MDNWKIACEYYNKKIQGTTISAKRVDNPLDPRMRCDQHLLYGLEKEVVTVRHLKCNLLCSLTKETPIDE